MNRRSSLSSKTIGYNAFCAKFYQPLPSCCAILCIYIYIYVLVVNKIYFGTARPIISQNREDLPLNTNMLLQRSTDMFLIMIYLLQFEEFS